MAVLLSLMGLFLVFGFVLFIIWIAAVKLGMLKPPTALNAEEKTDGEKLNYRVRDRVLSPAEYGFYALLQAAVHMLNSENPERRCTLFASVRLAEVLTVSEAQTNRSAWQRAFNRISSKQVDFVVCDEQTTRPLLVIELDDSTHKRADRAKRDEFVDSACRAAKLPVLHVPTSQKPDYKALARLIGQQLSGTRTPAGSSAS
ncbi:MAG: DUF2726 domain-containing protein [Phycisphaerales bacterium]|nr:DUF2726 domain-containing protein [Phycisphaerales bacterium]